MKKKISIILLIMLLFISGCNKNTNNPNNTTNIDNETVETNSNSTTIEGENILPEGNISVEDNSLLEEKCNNDICVTIKSFTYQKNFGGIYMIITRKNNNLTTGSFKMKFDTTCTPNEYKIVYDFTENLENEYEIQYLCEDLLKTSGYEIIT